MWSLHDVTENVKKYAVVGAIAFIIIVLLWIIASNIIDYLNRPKYVPPTQGFGLLPPIPFPGNATHQNLVYVLDTVDGKADLVNPNTTQPIPLSDRINVYKIIQPIPDLNSLQTAANKVAAVGFINDDGTPLQEKRVSQTTYTWNKTSGFAKAITMDITSYNFHLSSIYNLYPSVLAGNNMPASDTDAVNDVQTFLQTMQLTPANLDTSLTTTSDYTITNSSLVPVTSADQKILAIRVNFFQQGLNNLQIVYPNPPDTTMSFLVTGGDTNAEISQATFEPQTIDSSPQGSSDYPLKSASQAYADLQTGKGYILPTFQGGTPVQIKSISLAYYLGEITLQYAIPVYVFYGNNGFIAYVTAVADSAISSQAVSPTLPQ